MSKTFFPSRPESNPTIYAYKILNASDRKGLLKVGFTNRSAQERVKEQLGTTGLSYKIVLEESAMRNDGSAFTDHDVHRYLKQMKLPNPDGEWFECDLKDVVSAVLAIRNGESNVEHRTLDFKMRPEQEEAVEKTMQYLNSFNNENPDKTPHFLWNAKMRYGKTFATYQLAKKMGWKKVLVLT
ncbi:MAG: GIY-YIG nuclease family protein, partial [Candidatus Marinimicrobia bacterium]|nr:GIY-YIG nuclease family protein [Candidatus Neomarinimicrobiota bacterium]